MNDALARAVLDFWFLPTDSSGRDRYRPEWFGQDESFDIAVRTRFGADVEVALQGRLIPDPIDATAILAMILLLDPFPRMLFRGTVQSLSGDSQALALATSLVSSGRDKNLPPMRRLFVFMPFMHSETLLDQERAVALFAGLCREGQEPVFDLAYEQALRRREIFERFGRFPHRNALLGRLPTAEEGFYL